MTQKKHESKVEQSYAKHSVMSFPMTARGDKNPYQSLVDSLIEPGETVLWEGRPVVWQAMVGSTLHVLFGAIPTYACLYILLTDPQPPRAAKSGAFVFLALIALLLVTAPLQGAWIAYRTRYVLTNSRALLLE